MRLAEAIRLTQGAPDDDSRELVRALIDGPRRLAKTPDDRKRAERQVAILERHLPRSRRRRGSPTHSGCRVTAIGT